MGRLPDMATRKIQKRLVGCLLGIKANVTNVSETIELNGRGWNSAFCAKDEFDSSVSRLLIPE